jgi:serine/threonine protein kinase/class 3 adenylate cyclase/Tfp pilus assembly protein PilF
MPAPPPAASPVVKTLLLTDLVGSTDLARTLGDKRAAQLGGTCDRALRDVLARHGGQEIDKTDGYLILFDRPIDALRCALESHEALAQLSAAEGVELKARAGVHLGEVLLRENGAEDVARGAKPVEVEGLAKPLAARVMSLAKGGQTLLTRGAFDIARRAAVGSEAFPPGVKWREHGPYKFKGLDDAIDVCEAGVEARAPLAAPTNTEKAHRAIRAGEEELLGWRPAAGEEIQRRPGWRLERMLGAGGFGEVWLATHARTGDRRVFKFCFALDRLRALKRELTLFMLMREALGLRPDVQRLYDMNFDEPPYFLEMDYAEGGDLVDWSEARGGAAKVPLATRLELVAQIAVAAGAAHSLGVLHKDIKPRNILVDTSGERPQAKLTDFGIGQLEDKSILGRLQVEGSGFTEATLVESDLNSRTGTRLYSAPELVAGGLPSIQSDVYALGVTLFQAIIGDFSRPVTTDWRERARVAGADPVLLGDLDACLAGEPAERLPSATELATRLRSLPARRRARARRRLAKLTVAGAAALGLALVATLGLVKRERERSEQLAKARDRAESNEAKARTAEAEAHRRAEEAERNLSIARAQGDGAYDLALFVLDELKEGMEKELSVERGIPVPVANEIKHAIAGGVAGKVVAYYDSLAFDGWPDDMKLLHARRLGETGGRFHGLGRHAEGARLAAASLALREELLGPNHPETATALNDLASLLHSGGDFAAARPLYERALAIREATLGPEALDTAVTLNNLAMLLRATGAYGEALPLFERGRAIREKALGADDPDTALAINNLAAIHQAMGNYPAALALSREALAAREKALGPDHADTAASLNNVALLLRATGDAAAARPLLERALAINEVALGPNHPGTATSLNNLARALRDSGDAAAARPLYERSLAILEIALGPDHPNTATAANNLARLLQSLGDREAALPLFEKALAATERTLGPDHPDMAASLNNLALFHQEGGDLERARPLFQRALEVCVAALGAEHPNTAMVRLNLFGSLVALRRAAVAEAKAESPTEGLGAMPPDGSTSETRTEARSRARELAREAAELIDADDPAVAASPRARALLAECLLALDRRDEARALAERLLAEGYAEAAEGNDRASFLELVASLGLEADDASGADEAGGTRDAANQLGAADGADGRGSGD